MQAPPAPRTAVAPPSRVATPPLEAPAECWAVGTNLGSQNLLLCRVYRRTHRVITYYFVGFEVTARLT